MTVFYDDALAGVSAISNLTANLDGKFLVRNGCLEPFHKGKPFDEGGNPEANRQSMAGGKYGGQLYPLLEWERTSTDGNSMLRNGL